MSAPNGAPLSAWRATLHVARKELVASFRDRRTAIFVVVVPLALYPLLFWCLIQGATLAEGKREQAEVREAVLARADRGARAHPRGDLRGDPHGDARGDASGDARPDSRADSRPDSRPDSRTDTRTGSRSDSPMALDGSEPTSDATSTAWARDSARGVDRAARPEGDLPDAREDATVRAVRDATVAREPGAPSERALGSVERPATADAPPHTSTAGASALSPIPPFAREPARDVALEEDVGAYVLSSVVPLLLVVLIVMGAFSTAVDLTVGERERRTADTTALLPVPHLAVHQGKILAVCVMATIAVALNLFALAVSAAHLRSFVASDVALRLEFPLRALAAIAPLALAFALFASAVLCGIASRARTFQEGQAWLGPVQILFVVPTLAGLVVGTQLGFMASFVPVFNFAVVARSVVRGEATTISYALTMISLVGCAFLAARWAVGSLARRPASSSTVDARAAWDRAPRATGGTR